MRTIFSRLGTHLTQTSPPFASPLDSGDVLGMNTAKQLRAQAKRIRKQAEKDVRDLNAGRFSLGDLIRSLRRKRNW